MTIQEGNAFYSFTGLARAIQLYNEDMSLSLSEYSSVKFDSLEEVPKGITKIESKRASLVYYRITYACEFGTKRNSQAAATNRRPKKIGCPFTLVFECEGNKLVCTRKGTHIQHINGTLKRPKFSANEVHDTTTATKAKASVSYLVSDFNSKRTMKITNKDIHNMLRKFDLNTENKKYFNKLKEQHLLKTLLDNKNKEVAHVYQTEHMRYLWRNYNDCMMIDLTYNIIKKKLSLFTIILVNGEGQSEPACIFLIKDESVVSLRIVFELLKVENSFDDIETWLTDKDFSERAIIREYCKNAVLNLCYFHVKRAFQRHFTKNKLDLTKEERDAELLKVYKILCCKNEKEYNILVGSLSKKTDDYYKKNLHPIRSEFVEIFKENKMNLALRTTNRVESFFDKLKKYCKRKTSVEHFFKELDGFIKKRNNDHVEEIRNLYLKVDKSVTNSHLIKLKEIMTEYSWKYITLLQKESDKIVCEELDYDNSCMVCNSYEKMGLPCIHQLKKIHSPELLIPFVKKRWYHSTLFQVYNLDFEDHYKIVLSQYTKYSNFAFVEAKELYAQPQMFNITNDKKITHPHEYEILNVEEQSLVRRDKSNKQNTKRHDLRISTFKTINVLTTKLASIISDHHILNRKLGEDLLRKLIDDLDNEDIYEVLIRNGITEINLNKK